MTKTVKLTNAQLDALTPLEKIALAEQLIASACQQDTEWEQAWEDEAKRRLLALERGEATVQDANELLDRLASKHAPK